MYGLCGNKQICYHLFIDTLAWPNVETVDFTSLKELNNKVLQDRFFPNIGITAIDNLF